MSATIYRTRPRTVEAMRYTPSDLDQCEAIHAWLGIKHSKREHSPEATLEIANHEGRFLTITPGDWVVRDGMSLTVLSNQEFTATYEQSTGDER